MALILGKSFDRNYNIRVPFLDGFYNIGIFLNKKSTFLLFSVEQDYITNYKSVKVNMFKNLRSSKFCETFINLHDYKKSSLDIINQFDTIKESFNSDVNLFLNETINFSKIEVEKKTFYDTLSIFGFTMNIYNNEFAFIIAERQNVVRKLSRKIVRTTGIQISTSDPLKFLDDMSRKVTENRSIKPVKPKETIKLSDYDEEN